MDGPNWVAAQEADATSPAVVKCIEKGVTELLIENEEDAPVGVDADEIKRP